MHEEVQPSRRLDGQPHNGRSEAAMRRRDKRNRGVLHSGRPGDVIEMSGERKYAVANDGSFRRLKAA